MSVLINGMEMPRSCADCHLTWVDDEYDKRCCITNKVVLGTIGSQDNANCTDCDCPLIEVQSPHGRLIDADKLMRDIEEYHLSDGKFQHWVEVQQTIIEAEGSEDEDNNV